MDYEKELGRIWKLLEEVNCSDDEKSDENGFSSNSTVVVKKIVNKKTCTLPTLTIACQTLKIHKKVLKRKSQNLVHGIEKLKQHGGGKRTYMYVPWAYHVK